MVWRAWAIFVPATALYSLSTGHDDITVREPCFTREDGFDRLVARREGALLDDDDAAVAGTRADTLDDDAGFFAADDHEDGGAQTRDDLDVEGGDDGDDGDDGSDAFGGAFIAGPGVHLPALDPSLTQQQQSPMPLGPGSVGSASLGHPSLTPGKSPFGGGDSGSVPGAATPKQAAFAVRSWSGRKIYAPNSQRQPVADPFLGRLSTIVEPLSAADRSCRRSPQ